MIINGPNPNLPEAIARAEKMAKMRHETGNGVPCCGHDFWETAKKLEFGDVIMCNRCNVYYAKIKHLPWLVKPKKYASFTTDCSTYHCEGVWFVPVPARVTD